MPVNVRAAALIAVDTDVWAADKPYDYLVPAAMQEKLLPGMRVLVPFGRANRKTEGIVLAVGRHPAVRQLKSIESVLDDSPVLDERRLKLATYLRDRLYCTFYSLVRTMLPAGFWFKLEKEYRLPPERAAEALEALEGREEAAALVRALTERGCVASEPPAGVSRKALADMLETLCARGLLQVGSRASRTASEKTAKLYSLSSQLSEKLEAGEHPLRSAGQKEVVRFLSHAGSASARDICYYTGCSQPVIGGLLAKGLLEAREVEVLRRPSAPQEAEPAEIELNDEQQAAYEGIATLLDAGKSAAALLYGVTGSGKTQVYIRAISHALERGRSAIVLVPEIALTPQLTARFYAQFAGRVAVLHSALSVGERYDEWRRILRGDVDVVVGTRSAVFAPLANLGLVVIDEEHEHTYQSESEPRYHARDVAKYRCYQQDALLLLGSATPSVETAYFAETGRYALFRLSRRYGGAQLPQTVIADSREAFRAGYTGCIGPVLARELTRTLSRGEQAILLLNRRGASRMVSCMACGYVPMCVHCSVALSYHRANGRLVCHQCGYSCPAPDSCPACGGTHLDYVGAGTQQAEAELTAMFPGIRVLRMDSDTTSGRHSHEEILSKFASGGADVLLGTQMVAKGLDFANVTLSGILDADLSLYAGDWRAGERTFALIAQVAGRAGRGDKPGLAVIQTASPENEVIRAAAAQDYGAFYRAEIGLRRALRQPPFCRLLSLTLSGAIDEDAYQAARRLGARIRGLLSGEYAELGAELLGPAPAPVHKLNNRYRYTLTLRHQDGKRFREMTAGLLKEFLTDSKNKKIGIYADTYS